MHTHKMNKLYKISNKLSCCTTSEVDPWLYVWDQLNCFAIVLNSCIHNIHRHHENYHSQIVLIYDTNKKSSFMRTDFTEKERIPEWMKRGFSTWADIKEQNVMHIFKRGFSTKAYSKDQSVMHIFSKRRQWTWVVVCLLFSVSNVLCS